jgi:hypothetical protein
MVSMSTDPSQGLERTAEIREPGGQIPSLDVRLGARRQAQIFDMEFWSIEVMGGDYTDMGTLN